MMPFVFLVLLSFIIIPFHSFGQQCFRSHHDSLLRLKNGFSTTMITRCTLSSWVPSTDCCRWEGITCDASSRYVVSLDLAGCDFGPPLIFEALFNLTTLRALDLSGNNFNSSLPRTTEFELLKDLTHLDLSYSGFGGQVPLGISRLEKLVSLDLSDNYLGFLRLRISDLGTLVRNLSNLQVLYLDETMISDKAWSAALAELPATKLRRLGLAKCGLSGPIPTSLSKFTLLKELRLAGNDLSSQIPEFLTNLTSLQSLDISKNNLVGPLPGLVFNTLSNLVVFYASNNPHLHGKIPESIGNLTSLRILHLSDCSFFGQIPVSITNHTQLTDVYLGNRMYDEIDEAHRRGNNFTGPIPMFFGSSSSLESLDISGNHFVGLIPGSIFTTFTRLALFDASSNKGIYGPIPESIGNYTSLTTLRLSQCGLLAGQIPITINNLTRLQEVDLSGNNFAGPLPSFESSASSIAFIDLSYNHLNGSIPTTYHAFPNLIFFDISRNDLTGPLPKISFYHDNDALGLVSLIVYKNNLVGNLPSSICNGEHLLFLDVSDNNLSGEIPSCIFRMGELQVLNLRGNKFQGIIPPTMFTESCSLQTLDLNSNMFEGAFLSNLSNCYGLEVLNIGNNRFSGPFPNMSYLTNLRVLILRGNKFEGTLESLDVQSEALQVLDLSSNDFSGTLQPNIFLNMKAMMQVTSNNNGGNLDSLDIIFYQISFNFTCKGTKLNFERILTQFTVIDLSNNKFQGKIPDVIGNLTSLYLLDLSHNNLSGSIPISFGRLGALESLDLSWNNLSGEIPMQIDSLNFLEYLNLSKNSLSGRIPCKVHLCTFPNTSYIGNDNLCGEPLSKKCQASPPMIQSNDSRNNIHEGWLVRNMLYIFFAFGFCSGLAFFIAAMLICNDGRRWIYFHIDKVLYKVVPPGFWHW